MGWYLYFTHLRKIMSALTDLQAAVAKLGTDVSSALSAKDAQIASLQAQLAAAQASVGTSDADLASITASVNSIDSGLVPTGITPNP